MVKLLVGLKKIKKGHICMKYPDLALISKRILVYSNS